MFGSTIRSLLILGLVLGTLAFFVMPVSAQVTGVTASTMGLNNGELGVTATVKLPAGLKSIVSVKAVVWETGGTPPGSKENILLMKEVKAVSGFYEVKYSNLTSGKIHNVLVRVEYEFDLKLNIVVNSDPTTGTPK